MKAYAEREYSKLLSYNKQNASIRAKFQSKVVFTLFWHSFILNKVMISMCYLSKVLKSFLVVLKVSLILGCLVLGCL